jgi:C1A family cysteine protease
MAEPILPINPLSPTLQKAEFSPLLINRITLEVAGAARICNLVPSAATQNDFLFEHAVQAGLLKNILVNLAPHLDLREAWWDVGNQENTGSCVGWGSTDSVARYMFVKANRLAPTAKLSPRFTWMASKETDTLVSRPETMIEEAGTTLKAAVDILRNYGAALETMLPFHINTTMYTGNENTFFATCAQHKIAAYYNLQRNLANWRSWLGQHGPILVGLNVDHTWDNATATGGKLDTFMPTTVRGGHAVACVGYTPDGRFIIRNSWGTGWGDKGYAYASEAYINAAFYNESYGVTL